MKTEEKQNSKGHRKTKLIKWRNERGGKKQRNIRQGLMKLRFETTPDGLFIGLYLTVWDNISLGSICLAQLSPDREVCRGWRGFVRSVYESVATVRETTETGELAAMNKWRLYSCWPYRLSVDVASYDGWEGRFMRLRPFADTSGLLRISFLSSFVT